MRSFSYDCHWYERRQARTVLDVILKSSRHSRETAQSAHNQEYSFAGARFSSERASRLHTASEQLSLEPTDDSERFLTIR